MSERNDTHGKAPLTEDLLSELLASPSAQAYCDDHDFVDMNLTAYLEEMLEAKQKTKADVIREAGLNVTFGYQIFSGIRKPGRDKVLAIACAMRCTVRETQRMLKRAGSNELYVRDRRDAIILFCIEQGCSLAQTDEMLYQFGEKTIQSAS